MGLFVSDDKEKISSSKVINLKIVHNENFKLTEYKVQLQKMVRYAEAITHPIFKVYIKF